MAGARLILNARYFHIARAGEKADGKHVMTKDATMGLVNYVGTREGVQLNTEQLTFEGAPLNLDPLKLDAAVAARPATIKQLDLIAEMLHEIPEAKNSLEYQDFKEKPTISNASELISHAAELGLGYAVDFGKATNLVDYVANRPGVDRVGEHGLFSSAPSVDIKKAQEEIANCKGNIWTQVISLRREDADRLGYDQQKPWRDLVNAKIDTIAKAMNIPLSELHWYAGMHNTTHHPHIHLFVFSDNPKAGRLTVDGINKIKSEFSEVIFADERRHIYEHKDDIRDGIKRKVDDIFSHLQDGANGQFSQEDMKIMCDKLMRLSGDLKGRSGKMQFGWIKDLNIRKQVNSIMADLAKAPDIQQLYSLYCEDHKELQRMYRNDPKDLSPLVKLEEFKSIKNRIIREALRVSNIHLESEPANIPDTTQDPLSEDSFGSDEGHASPMATEDEMSLFESVPEDQTVSAPQEDYEAYGDFIPVTVPESEKQPVHHRVRPSEMDFSEVYAKAFDGDPSARYQLARRYFYGNGADRDYAQAQMWYGLAAAEGHSLAKYELGKMYLYGIGIEKDIGLGNEYCRDAFSDFTFELKETTGVDVESSTFRCEDLPKTDSYHAYLEYLVGRMRLAGEGVEKDNVLACSWFRASAWHEHVHAKYMLAKMYYDGKGVPQDYSFALSLYKEAADSEDKYACYAAGRMYFRGIGTAQDYGKAASLFMKASKKNVPYADYVLAQMAESGLGITKDEEASSVLYQKALKEFEEQEKQQPEPLTECRIAFQYLLGKGVAADAAKAAEWFQKAAEQDNPQADFQLAALYASGTGVPVDSERASDLYKKALTGFLEAEKDNPEAGQEYRISQMYEKGLGVEVNPEEMIRWLTVAAEHGHGHAAYRLGKSYLDPEYVSCDVSTALKWFRAAAELKDKYAYYSLGKMYHDGTGVNQDFAQSAKWLQLASDANLPYAGYLLAEQYGAGQGVKKDVDRAYSLYAKALKAFLLAEQDKPGTMLEYRIGSMYLQGNGTAENPMEALKWFELSAGKGNAFAAYQAAGLYSRGNAIPKDEKKAHDYFAAALAGFLQIEKEAPDAMLEYRIGSMFLHGNGTAENPVEALHWFELSANKGNAFAAYQAAELYSQGKDIPKDEKKAHDYFAAALADFLQIEKEAPDAALEYRIGGMYLNGNGTAENPVEALKWFELSAGKDNAFAAYQAAGLYSRGNTLPKNERKAHDYFAAALAKFLQIEKDSSDPVLEYRIGKMHLHGNGTAENPAEALRWFELSSGKGNAFAAYQAAELYSAGKAIPKDEKKAHDYFAAALAGFLQIEKDSLDPVLEYRIGNMYLRGNGTTQNPAEALRWFELSSGKGNAFAAYQAAELYSTGKAIPKDGVKARGYFATALTGFLQVEKEAPDAMLEYRIGKMHLYGNGTAENPVEALRWFEKSAGNGNVFAAYEAAVLMESGHKVPQNPMRAQIYFNQALNGFIKADLASPDDSMEYRIGQMFFQGKGTAMNVAAAIKWLALSAGKDNPYAQFQLAEIYQKGEWIPQNKEYARSLYLSALNSFQKLLQQQPDSSLQYRIGTMYERGLGVDRDMSTAKSWYSLAADAGNEIAAERLNQIASFESQAAVFSIFNLFRSLAREMGNNINDSTTHKYRPERKLLQKQREMAHTQKHSQEQTG